MFRLGVSLVIVGLLTITLAGGFLICPACPYIQNQTVSCQCEFPGNWIVAFWLGIALVIAGIVALFIKGRPPNPPQSLGMSKG